MSNLRKVWKAMWPTKAVTVFTDHVYETADNGVLTFTGIRTLVRIPLVIDQKTHGGREVAVDLTPAVALALAESLTYYAHHAVRIDRDR